ncbi:MAG: hypothetical protein AMXMBFR66_02720 [Pseudomonadota bacterium]
MEPDAARLEVAPPLPAAARYTDYIPTSACNLCGARDDTLVAIRDRRGAGLKVTCCMACGLTYVDPLPSAAELAAHDARQYRRDYKSADSPASNTSTAQDGLRRSASALSPCWRSRRHGCSTAAPAAASSPTCWRAAAIA